MHEMSLAESMLQIVDETARKNGATKVTAVRLELGALSHVEADALRFCFDAVARGGLAEGAQLEIVTTPGRAWCMPCGDTVDLARLGDACPRCGGYQLQVTQGEEMRLKDIEIAG
jgi:hydrogenase nickel incorporation protein HypA/HybF